MCRLLLNENRTLRISVLENKSPRRKDGSFLFIYMLWFVLEAAVLTCSGTDDLLSAGFISSTDLLRDRLLQGDSAQEQGNIHGIRPRFQAVNTGKKGATLSHWWCAASSLRAKVCTERVKLFQMNSSFLPPILKHYGNSSSIAQFSNFSSYQNHLESIWKGISASHCQGI